MVFNFIGEPIIQRWSEKAKKRILSSRVNSTYILVNSISEVNPKIYLVQSSAIGIYDLINWHDESSKLYANDFLGYVVKSWEGCLLQNTKFNNYCIVRLGLILNQNGGYLQSVSKSFKLKFGNYFGQRSNSFAFIDSSDFLRALEFILAKRMVGIANLVSPDITDNYSVAKILRIIYKTWFLIPMPDFVLKLIFGEGFYMLKGTPKVLPKRLLEEGFSFSFKSIEASLKHQLQKN